MEKENIIYEANPLEKLTNDYWILQRRLELGENVSLEAEKTWDEIKEIIESDEKIQLEGLRIRLRNVVREELKGGD